MNRLSRILLVEDDTDVRDIIQMALEDVGGYAVIACASGEEAVALATTLTPDFIILDVMMPDMDGPTTLAALRCIAALAHTPAIFITAMKQPASMQPYSDPWVLDTLVKPFHHRTFVSRIAQLWEEYCQRTTALNDTNGTDERLALIRERFLSSLPARIANMESLHTLGTDDALQRLAAEAHRLSGISSMLEFAQLSTTAEALEQALNAKASDVGRLFSRLQAAAASIDR